MTDEPPASPAPDAHRPGLPTGSDGNRARRWTERALDWVEWAGNKLPDPVVLFFGALILTWAASAVLATIPFTEIDPRTLGPGRVAEPVRIKNQLDGVAFVTFLSRMVKTFVEFPPLGLV